MNATAEDVRFYADVPEGLANVSLEYAARLMRPRIHLNGVVPPAVREGQALMAALLATKSWSPAEVPPTMLTLMVAPWVSNGYNHG